MKNHPVIKSDNFHIGLAESDFVLISLHDDSTMIAKYIVNYDDSNVQHYWETPAGQFLNLKDVSYWTYIGE